MNLIELARNAGLGDVGAREGFIFFQPGVQGLQRFAAAILECAARSALEECPTLDGELCAKAIRELREELKK